MTDKTTQTEKAASPAIGNAIAYFLVPILGNSGWILFEDKSLAVAMGGAVVAWMLLQLRTFFGWCARVIERAIA